MKHYLDDKQETELKKADVYLHDGCESKWVPRTIGELIEWVNTNYKGFWGMAPRKGSWDVYTIADKWNGKLIDALCELALKIKEEK